MINKENSSKGFIMRKHRYPYILKKNYCMQTILLANTGIKVDAVHDAGIAPIHIQMKLPKIFMKNL